MHLVLVMGIALIGTDLDGFDGLSLSKTIQNAYHPLPGGQARVLIAKDAFHCGALLTGGDIVDIDELNYPPVVKHCRNIAV